MNKLIITDKLRPGGIQGDEVINAVDSQERPWKFTLQDIANISANYADILEIPTTENDTDLVLKPDGAGGVEWGTDAGGVTILGNLNELLASDGAGGITADPNFTWDGTQFIISDGSNTTKIQGDSLLISNDNNSINGTSGDTPQLGTYFSLEAQSTYDANNFVNISLLGSSDSGKNRITFRVKDSGVSNSLYYNNTGLYYGSDLSSGYTDRHVPDVHYVHNPNLKSGANQGAAGASAGELWIDTSANYVIKMGV
jgi:hypothetical protein